ncbi:MAG: dienelactone hydrolase family protein [Pseudoxanthomonas sp.]|nr:dienelactone hydrolase family protein [Pseudoxanthomonas sp.]
MMAADQAEGAMGEAIRIAGAGMHCIGAWRARPQGRALGGVVVVQEIFGVNAHIRAVVEDFAQAGFEAIAPALFDHVEDGVELDYDEPGVARGRALAAELGFERAVAGVAAAAEAIASAGRIAAVGYCWGGTVAFLACTRLAMPAVDYYGGRSLPFLGERPRAPLLLHFGERDPLIPPEDVERHRQALAGTDATIHVYPAGHGFNCDRRADHEPASAALARDRTLDFLRRHL